MVKKTDNRPAAYLYVRVSSDQQTPENQLSDLRQLAVARGFRVAKVWQEIESAKAGQARPVLAEMLREVRGGKASCVCVWALDRLHRSMAGMVAEVLALDRLHVRVLSVREPWLDNEGPVRALLVAIFGWVAEQERARMLDRQLASRARLEREGRSWGRPKRIGEDQAGIMRQMRADGRGVRSIAQACKVPKSTVARALKRPQASQKSPR